MKEDSTNDFDSAVCDVSFRAKTGCGAVLTEQGARLARLTRGAALDVFLSSDAQAMNRFAAESRSRTMLVAGCVPVKDSLTLWLTAPFSSFSKARKVLPSLLDVALPFPLEQCVYQFLDFSNTPEKTTRALAVAARRNHVQQLLDRYRSSGIDPELLDHEGLALWAGSVMEQAVSGDSSRVVLRLAKGGASIVIGRGGSFAAAHSVDHGDNGSDPDLLSKLIQRYLLAEIEPGKPVEWAFCGERAADSAFVKKLHASLAAAWPGECIVHDAPESFLCRALAVRALNSGDLRCNLRRGLLVHPKLPGIARRRTRTGVMLILAAGLLLCGLNIAWHMYIERRLARARDAVTSLAAALAPDVRIQYGMEVADAKKSIKRQSEMTAPFLEAFEPSLVAGLAGIIAAGSKHNMRLDALSLGRDKVAISGAAEDWNQCGEFAARLREMGYTLALDRQEAIADGLVRFTVKGNMLSE